MLQDSMPSPHAATPQTSTSLPPRRAAYLTHRSSGQGLVEYALIIMLVAMVVFAALALIGPSLANFFSSVPAQL